jgi:hypothetical protein
MTPTTCGATFTDPLGGPVMRCRRALGHRGAHDTIAISSSISWLLPPAQTFPWALTGDDADLIDRALEVMHRQLWAVRRGQSEHAIRERMHIDRVRASLVEARKGERTDVG